jgi:hypothetical protein
VDGTIGNRLASRTLTLTRTAQSDRQEVRQMPQTFYDLCEGPIPGLRLPLNAWEVLQRENITTLDQLKAVADRIERFEGIGHRTAQAIRAELTRLAASDGKPHDNGRP